MNRWMSPLSVGRATALATLVLGLALALGSFRARAIETTHKEDPTPDPAARALPQEDGVNPMALGGAAAPLAKEKKESLTYGGKSFAEWRAVLTSDLKPEVRTEAIKALSAFGTNGYGKEAAEAIIEAMRGYDIELSHQYDEHVISEARSAFGKIGSEGRAALVSELKHGKKNGRRFAIVALTEMHIRAKPAVPAVIEAFGDEDLFIRSHALNHVFDIDSNPKSLVPATIAALQHADPETRRLAALLLARSPYHARSAVPALLAALRDDDSQVRQGAVAAVQVIYATAEEAVPVHATAEKTVPALITALKDRDLSVRILVRGVLGSLGAEAKEAVPALSASFKESNRDEWASIALALGNIGPAAKEAMPILADCLRRESIGNEASAAIQKALGQINYRPLRQP